MNINLNSGKVCTLIGLIANIVLTILKLLLGIIGRSQAMIADALHSFSDIVGTGIVYASLHISEKPPDKEHPYGHGNAETLSALFVAITLLATGIYISWSALYTLWYKNFEAPRYIALIGAIISIIVNEILFHYTIKVGRLTKSSAIIANAYDHRSDAYSSIAALIGISGALLGFPYLDPIAGLVIAILIVKMSLHILKQNVQVLMDSMPDKELEEKIIELCMQNENIHKEPIIRLHPVGAGRAVAEVSIAVNENLSVRQGHSIAEQVKHNLLNNLSDLMDVIIHVDPGTGFDGIVYVIPQGDLEQQVYSLTRNFVGVLDLHNVHLYQIQQKILLTLDIEVDAILSLKEAHIIAHNLKNELLKIEPIGGVNVHIDFEGSDM